MTKTVIAARLVPARWFRFAVFLLVAGGLAMAGSPSRAFDQPFPAVNPDSGNPQAIKEGAKLFYKWCAACHGVHADGVSRFGSYAANLTNFWRGYCNFVVIVLNGRTKKQMPPWGGILDEEEIQKIGAFLETKGSEKAKWKGKCAPYLSR